MKKYLLDLCVTQRLEMGRNYVLLKAKAQHPLPEMLPGQFAELRVDGAPNVLLRRPISINFVDKEKQEVWLLIQVVGAGTQALARLQAGDLLNALLPLGNRFSLPQKPGSEVLLVGGGVGVAPLLFLGAELKEKGHLPTFLLGARTQDDLLELQEFARYGKVLLTTEDGSVGQQGFVTHHSVWQEASFSHIYCCGPKPMMQAVAAKAAAAKTPCEVSLENTMACGIGACLCCVEPTKRGNICVCTEGPIFNTNELQW